MRVHGVREDVALQKHHILKKLFNSVATEEGVLEQENYPFIETLCYLVQGNSTYLNVKT